MGASFEARLSSDLVTRYHCHRETVNLLRPVTSVDSVDPQETWLAYSAEYNHLSVSASSSKTPRA